MPKIPGALSSNSICRLLPISKFIILHSQSYYSATTPTKATKAFFFKLTDAICILKQNYKNGHKFIVS